MIKQQPPDVEIATLRSLLRKNNEYLQTVIICGCSKMYRTEWADALAEHELGRYGDKLPPLQYLATSELEAKCCPKIATQEGIEYYWINTEYAMAYSDLDDPLLLDKFTCPNCEAVHPVLMCGHHRLYRAVVENKPELPVFFMNEYGNYYVYGEERLLA